jgi:hypothetical protein
MNKNTDFSMKIFTVSTIEFNCFDTKADRLMAMIHSPLGSDLERTALPIIIQQTDKTNPVGRSISERRGVL